MHDSAMQQASACKEIFLKTKLLLAAGLTLSLSAFARTNSRTPLTVGPNLTSTFRVIVVSRTVQAVNYEYRSGSSKLDFAGTELDAIGQW